MEGFKSVGSPCGGHRRVAATHSGLKILILDLASQVVGEEHLQVLIDEGHVSKAESKAKIVAQLNEVTNREPNSLQRIFYNIFTELAARSNRYGISVYHAETLLEDRALRLGIGNFFLASVAN